MKSWALIALALAVAGCGENTFQVVVTEGVVAFDTGAGFGAGAIIAGAGTFPPDPASVGCAASVPVLAG